MGRLDKPVENHSHNYLGWIIESLDGAGWVTKSWRGWKFDIDLAKAHRFALHEDAELAIKMGIGLQGHRVIIRPLVRYLISK